MRLGDVLTYVRDRAGTTALFPESHPTPPTSSSVIERREESRDKSAPKAPEDPAEIRLRFLQLTRHPNEIDYWLRRGELPSTRALTLRRQSLATIAASLDYYVCEKTDGVRYCLVATREGTLALLDRAMEVRAENASPALVAWLSSRPGDTVLDGELVSDMTTGEDMFIIFDALVVDGERTGLWHSFTRRLKAAESWLDEALESSDFPFDVIMKTQTRCEKLDEVNSRFTDSPDGHGWIYSDGNCTHISDGLIFTPAHVSYYVCMPFKWKPANLMTVDFSVSMSDLASRQAMVSGSVKMHESDVTVCEVFVDRTEAWVRELLTGHRGARSVILECIFLSSEGIWRALKYRTDKNVPNSIRTAFSTLEAVAEGLTLKFLVDHLGGITPSAGALWEKSGADAADKLASYTHLSLQQLQGRGKILQADRSNIKVSNSRDEQRNKPESTNSSDEQQKRPVPIPRDEQQNKPDAAEVSGKNETTVGQNVSAIETEVGVHYDRIQRERWETGKNGLDSKIAMLRKFQNWSKACMIKRLRDVGFDNNVDYEELLNELRIAFDISAVNPMFEPLQGKAPISQSSRIPMKVLDLACGRGGDLNKWTRENIVNLYVGVDVSGEELIEAEQRAKGLDRQRQSPTFHFYRSSCDSPTLLKELYDYVNTRNPSVLDARIHRDRLLSGFNVVWCQFALHYFCGSRESLHAFLKNVSDSLIRGGRFCASFPNPLVVGRYLAHMRQSGEKSFGSSTCYVSVDEILEISDDQLLNEFGIKYKFTLGDAVQDCAEFVVPLESLVSLAKKLNLRLVRLTQMHAFMSKCAHDQELAYLREVMQITGSKSPGRLLTSEEWDAMGFYCICVMEKM